MNIVHRYTDDKTKIAKKWNSKEIKSLWGREATTGKGHGGFLIEYLNSVFR